MLFITQLAEQISYAQLMCVYEESNRLSGQRFYPRQTPSEQLLLAEQDLYCYLQLALREGGWFAAWTVSGSYKSALRLEPYADGLLITALETAIDAREKGYATALLRAVVDFFPSEKIYTHIYADNKISMRLHERIGFMQISNDAHFLDGSTSVDAYTFLYKR